jgi:hypothetical protein
MSTSIEDPAVTPPTQRRTSRKMLQLLRKRLRQLMWATLGLAIFLVVAGGVFAIWWLNSLNGLPDIGDPFDVAELRAIRIPDDQNAFILLLRASEKLTPLKESSPVARAAALTVKWSQASPELRAWVEANRAVLGLLQDGANRSDGISRPPGGDFLPGSYMFNPDGLMRLACLEGARREESGDTAGAWDCYRAILRMSTHFRRRGNLFERWIANSIHSPLQQRLTTWVADPKTTIPQLRRALEEIVESRPRPEWDAFSLRISYFDMIRLLERSVDPIHRAIDEGMTYRLGSYEVPVDLAVHLYGVQRFLKREPERSKRVVKLIFANWLAHVEVPGLRQSPPAVRAAFSFGKGTGSAMLYATSPNAPAVARVLSPQQVAIWLVTADDVKPFLVGHMWPSVHIQELKNHRQLVLLLAEELYRRERGMLPATEQDLVGTYLETLPDDGSGELDDGTAQTVTNSRAVDGTSPR